MWLDDLRAIRKAAKDDLQTASAVHRVAFWSTACLFLIDIPAHEAILGLIGGNVFRTTKSPLWTGVVVGGTSLALETLLSSGVSANLL
jgi:hypothetical protein